MQNKLLFEKRIAQVVFQRGTLFNRNLHCRIEKRDQVSARMLCPIHCQFNLLQQRFRCYFGTIKQADPDTGRIAVDTGLYTKFLVQDG